MDIAERLAQYSLFRGVDAVDRKALIDVMQRKHYNAGDVLFNRGDHGDSMYIILNGSVRIYTQDVDGNEFTVRYLEEMFGEFTMLDSRPRSAAAAAVGELDVLILHRDDFINFLRERPVVGLSMMRNLVERVRYTTTYLQQVIDATQQIAQGNYDYLQNVTPDANQSESQTEIQELIGSFVEMVQGIQTREQSLKRALDAQAKPNSAD